MKVDYKRLFKLISCETDRLFILLSSQLKVLDVNPLVENFLGWKKQDVFHQDIGTLFKEYGMRPFITDLVQKTTVKVTEVEKKNGVLKIIWSMFPIQTLDNKGGIFVSGKIKNLAEDNGFDIAPLNNIIKYAPGLVYWKDKNSVYQGCNDEFARLAGLESSEEVKGRTDFDLIWKEGAASYVESDQQVLKTGKPNLNLEEVVAISNNKKLTMISNKVPLLNSNNEVVGIMGITMDITHQKEIEYDLKKAKEAAEAANQAKMAFIANISHDIRTPLAGVIGLSEILENAVENPEQKRDAHLLRDSGEELLFMLNDVLADIQAGHVGEDDIYNESFDLYQCVDDLVKLEQPTIALKGLRLDVSISPDVPRFILSDRKKIHRILLNLLGNAIKFTKEGGITIEIKCLEENGDKIRLQFGVEDTGIGISRDVQDKVFERFFRGTPSYKGMYTGHGLGLHIVQSYVRILGGTIRLTSEEGVGTTLYFDLRCKKGNEMTQKKASALDVLQETLVENGEESIVTEETKNVPYLLLVEDNAIALKILESIVSNAGYRFKSVTNGQSALAFAMSGAFDLMIADIGLPDLSGTELTFRIREWEKTQGKTPLPIVGLTGHAREVAHEECLASGMNNVFTKPASLSLIKKLVKEYVLNQTKARSKGKEAVFKTTSGLGVDLPKTEAALFELDVFPLFDLKSALHQVHDLSLLFQLLKSSISEQAQEDIRQMKEAYQHGDWDSIEKLAHKLKGGAVYIGTTRMQYACQYFERYYKAGHRVLLEKLYSQLLNVNEETCETLHQWLDNYS